MDMMWVTEFRVMLCSSPFYLYCEIREINVSQKFRVIRYTESFPYNFKYLNPENGYPFPGGGGSRMVQAIIASNAPPSGFDFHRLL